MRIPDRWALFSVLMLMAVVSAAYLATASTVADGPAVAPLDDAYITFQYARQIARGYPYQYNDGDPPTTGMTSPLYGFLLAGFYLIGFTGERQVALALGMGVLWLGLIGWLTCRLTLRLTGEGQDARSWATGAAALVLLSGPVQWGCFNGMETGLFTVLTLAGLDAFLARRPGWSALWLGLAGLARPEGLILAGLAWTVALAGDLVRRRAIRWRQVGPLSAAVAVGLAPLGVNWLLTGTAVASGVQAKSWLYNVPFYPAEIARSVLLFYGQILERFLGWGSPAQWFFPPGLLVFSFAGWGALAMRRRWESLILTASWFFLGTLSIATLITALWHYGRYQVPLAPLLSALAFGGLAALHGRGGRWRYPAVGIGLVLIVASAYTGVMGREVYWQAVETVAAQQRVVAEWLRQNLPAGARVGVHDAGSLRYLGDHPTCDLIGLTTPGAAIAWRHGAGSVFELMEHSPMRPDYFAIYPDVFSIPYLAATDLFAEELLRVEVPDYAVASAGPVQGVWRADWSLAGSGERFYQPDVIQRTSGLRLVDTLDVADLADEAAHNVVWWHEAHRSGFPTEVWQMAYRVLPDREVLDGGRLLTGGIGFDVQTRPGQPLWIVARLHAQEAGAVRVEVDGQDVGHWAYPAVPGQWLETVFRVPGGSITSARTRLVLRVDAEDPDFRHYAPYYFWFLQGEPEVRPVEIGRQVEAVFEGGIRLLGFDLEEQVWRAGETVPLVLYWQIVTATGSDAKVFLHLYDADGNLGPQSDGWAYHDTRPPYTWSPGEVVADERALVLPEDLEPGLYSVEVGLYDPESLVRLPAYRNGVRMPDDRLPLARIEIRE